MNLLGNLSDHQQLIEVLFLLDFLEKLLYIFRRVLVQIRMEYYEIKIDLLVKICITIFSLFFFFLQNMIFLSRIYY